MKNRFGKGAWIILGLAVFLALAVLFYAPILNSAARSLVHQDPLRPCDAILVLTGDATGDRLIGAVDLWKKGYGKKIVFWGGPVYWKISIAELYLRLLKSYGIPPEAAFYSEEKLREVSTNGEAEMNMALLEKADAKSFILVTSDYHTARATFVYSPYAKAHGMKMVVHPVKEQGIVLENWWKDRASAKMVWIEFEKTVWYRIQKLL